MHLFHQLLQNQFIIADKLSCKFSPVIWPDFSSFCWLNSIAISIFFMAIPSSIYLASSSLPIWVAVYWSHLKLFKIEETSFAWWIMGTCWQTLKQSTRSRACKSYLILVVPMIINFLCEVGGAFLIRTKSDCRITFENLGPMWIYSMSLSMSSRIIKDKSDLYASSKILAILAILEWSLSPTNCSGEII